MNSHSVCGAEDDIRLSSEEIPRIYGTKIPLLCSQGPGTSSYLEQAECIPYC
jgi:hypothetical protein